MDKVPPLAERRARSQEPPVPTIKKIIDGKVVEYVNLDTMTPAQLARYLACEDPGAEIIPLPIS